MSAISAKGLRRTAPLSPELHHEWFRSPDVQNFILALKRSRTDLFNRNRVSTKVDHSDQRKKLTRRQQTLGSLPFISPDTQRQKNTRNKARMMPASRETKHRNDCGVAQEGRNIILMLRENVTLVHVWGIQGGETREGRVGVLPSEMIWRLASEAHWWDTLLKNENRVRKNYQPISIVQVTCTGVGEKDWHCLRGQSDWIWKGTVLSRVCQLGRGESWRKDCAWSESIHFHNPSAANVPEEWAARTSLEKVVRLVRLAPPEVSSWSSSFLRNEPCASQNGPVPYAVSCRSL